MSGTRVEELERMCAFLIVLHEALWQTYANDKRVTHSVLAMLSPDRKGTAPELVVKHARQFLEGEIQ